MCLWSWCAQYAVATKATGDIVHIPVTNGMHINLYDNGPHINLYDNEDYNALGKSQYYTPVDPLIYVPTVKPHSKGNIWDFCGDFGIPWALGAHGPALEISQEISQNADLINQRPTPAPRYGN